MYSMDELPDDVIGVIFNAIPNITAFGCTCARIAAIASAHPDMVFWRSRNIVEVSFLANDKFIGAMRTLTIWQMVHKPAHLACTNRQVCDVVVDYFNKYGDEATARIIPIIYRNLSNTLYVRARISARGGKICTELLNNRTIMMTMKN